MPEKDHNRNKIYEAEKAFASDHPEAVMTPDVLQYRARRAIRRAPFKKLLLPRVCSTISVCQTFRGRICVPTLSVLGAEAWGIFVSDAPTLHEVFHSMAHGILDKHYNSGEMWPSGAIHDVEFVKMNLDLVRRFYEDTASPQRMAEAKQYLVERKVKTSTKSPEARQAASRRWHQKRTVPSVREALLKMREELQEDV